MSIHFVTALYNIDREQKGDGRKFNEYLEWFKNTLKISSPMTIFVPKELKDFVLKHREGKVTNLVLQTIDQIPYMCYLEDVTRILQSSIFKTKMTAIHRIECQLPMYNIVTHSKWNWVKQAIELDVNQSSMYFWIDAGASRFFDNIDLNKDYPDPSNIKSILNYQNFVLIEGCMSYYPDLINNITDDILWDGRSWLWGVLS